MLAAEWNNECDAIIFLQSGILPLYREKVAFNEPHFPQLYHSSCTRTDLLISERTRTHYGGVCPIMHESWPP